MLTEPQLVKALVAEGPSPEIPPEDRIYDWLIGSWSARVVDHLGDGRQRESTGEWHFAWVLEGRAIQDVWIAPPRRLRNRDTPKQGNRYGTSIRAYHPGERRWHVTWINPVCGVINRLVARKQGDSIIQEGIDDSGQPLRWVFTDIIPNEARWYGEHSRNGGKSWTLEAEFFLKRI